MRHWKTIFANTIFFVTIFSIASLLASIPISIASIVSGNVTDTNNSPLADVTVTLSARVIGGEEVSEETTTDEEGFYQFADITKDSRCTFKFKKTGYRPKTVLKYLTEDTYPLDVTMEDLQGSTIVITVSGKGDESVDYVKLKIVGEKTGFSSTGTTGVEEDGEGYYEFEGLDADTYTIVARKKNYKKAQKK